jgi:hypothetical protein
VIKKRLELTNNLKIKNPGNCGERTLALIFILCLAKMPYGHYEFIRVYCTGKLSLLNIKLREVVLAVLFPAFTLKFIWAEHWMENGK